MLFDQDLRLLRIWKDLIFEKKFLSVWTEIKSFKTCILKMQKR